MKTVLNNLKDKAFIDKGELLEEKNGIQLGMMKK